MAKSYHAFTRYVKCQVRREVIPEWSGIPVWFWKSVVFVAADGHLSNPSPSPIWRGRCNQWPCILSKSLPNLTWRPSGLKAKDAPSLLYFSLVFRLLLETDSKTMSLFTYLNHPLPSLPPQNSFSLPRLRI
jgi:hypothetical protein